MDRQADVFFSDEEVARFAKGRTFLGPPPADGPLAGAPGIAFASSLDDAGPFYILPAADQYQRIREEAERRELQRSREAGEPYVTVDSLPYVHNALSPIARDRSMCMQEKSASAPPEKETLAAADERCNNAKTKSISDIMREGGLSDGMISSDEDAPAAKDETAKSESLPPETNISIDLLKSEPVDQGGAKYETLKSESLPPESNISIDLLNSETAKQDGGGADAVKEESGDASSYSSESSNATSSAQISKRKRLREVVREDSSSEDEELSDELISSSDEEGERNAQKPLPAAAAASKSKTLITSSNAIGSSINLSNQDEPGWHSRRSGSDAVLFRIKRKQQRSLLKKPRRRQKAAVATSTFDSPDRPGDAGQAERRVTLRFAAAPVAVNKRKKQTSLKSLFKKT